MHDKLNRFGVTGFAARATIKPSLIGKHLLTILLNSIGEISAAKQFPLTKSTKSVIGSGNLKSSKISATPIRKNSDIFIFRRDLHVTDEMLRSKLFLVFDDVTMTQLVTKHPIYVSFNKHNSLTVFSKLKRSIGIIFMA